MVKGIGTKTQRKNKKWDSRGLKDRLFTGQRLDGTGLYYCGARCYELVSADTGRRDTGGGGTRSFAALKDDRRGK